MNYQKIACWGDSQTFGARTYGCYPVYLAKILNATTQYSWHTINLSTNGHTARDVWFRLGTELSVIQDVYQACVLIGANDVGSRSPPELFEEYYHQILIALEIKGLRVVHCGEIPPIFPDGHAFFATGCSELRNEYNARLRSVVERSRIAKLVCFPALTKDCYVDPVHFNEKGNELVACCFAEQIVSF